MVNAWSQTADVDGDGVPDTPDNCPAWPNPDQSLPPWPVPANDPDCDGFTDAQEAFVGTDPARACAATGVADGIDNDADTTIDEPGEAANDEPQPDAWPLDFNDDQIVNILDVVQLMPPVFGSKVDPNGDGDFGDADPNYSVRKDFDGNGWINILDIVRLTPPTFGKSCTP